MRTWRAWILVAKRQWGARKGLVGVALVACALPLVVTVVTAVASSSAAPKAGELADRNLGPFQLRVQADSPEELADLRKIGDSHGASTQLASITTPGVLLTPDSAAEVTVEAGPVDHALLTSRFRLLQGTAPQTGNELGLAKNAAIALGVGVGGDVEWGGQTFRVSGILHERSNFDSRFALVPASIDAGDVSLGDSSRTHYNLYLAGSGSVADLQDAYLRVGYGVLTRISGAESVQHDDGEFVSLLRRMAIALLTLSLVIVVACMALVARLVESDLHTLELLGFTSRARSLLAGSVGFLVGLVAASVGVSAGALVAVWAREPLERMLGSEWYATRADPTWLVLAVLLIIGGASVAAALWSRSSGTAGLIRKRVRRAPSDAWTRAARALAIIGLVAGGAALLGGKATFLLAVAVLMAPALAVLLWTWVSARLHREGMSSRLGIVLTSYLSDRPVVPLVTATVMAGLLAFPVTAVLMIAGVEGGAGGPAQANVPRPDMAVYTGVSDLAANDRAAIAAEAGAESSASWSLALLPAGLTGEQASAWIPALPEHAMRFCSVTGGRPAGPAEEAACAAGFRGTAIATADTVEDILGRTLSDDERQFFSEGGALTLDEMTSDADRMRLIPVSAIGAAFDQRGIELHSRLVRPGAGTQVSRATPAVWLSAEVFGGGSDAQSAVLGDKEVRSGQQQAAFAFSGAVTVHAEQLLRRAIVTRVEVSTAEEFLITRLDASRVSAVRSLLDNYYVLALLVAGVMAAYAALALGRELRDDQRVLDDLGMARGATATWRGALVAGSTATGAVAALVTGAAGAVLIVWAEVGGAVPVSGWISVIPTLFVPLLAAVAATVLTFAWRRRSTAWDLGFVRE